MELATKIKSTLTMWLCAMVVMLSLGETRAGDFLAADQLESGQIAVTNQGSISDFYDASQYDASGYAVAPSSGGAYKFPRSKGSEGAYAKWWNKNNGAHGNARTGGTDATLYGKFDADGNFQKWGISKDPQTRYTSKELDGGFVKEYRTGPRDQILDRERKLTERFPGSQNNEAWAGRKNPNHSNYQGGN